MTQKPSYSAPWSPYLAVGTSLFFALFLAWMHLDGHTPSRPGPLIPDGQPYLWQALLTPPWLFLTLLLFAALIHLFAPSGESKPPFRQTLNGCATAFFAPLLLTFLLPESITYAIAGHDALSAALRFTGPLTLALWLILSHRLLRRLHQLSFARALWIAPAALLLALLFMSLVVR